jgi:serine/threonine protein kinase
MLRPGETLNHGAYRIERELGTGGFGVVYLAEELRLRRKVAIKTLLPDLVAREPALAETFYAEARLTAGLAHPHILPIHFVGEEERGDERLPYIVMEYIEGGDLEAVLAQGRGDLPQRLRWMRQIADGLAYAHAQGVIHRDLKPRNIFLTRTNTAKIGDFGLAKVMGAETQTFLKGLGTAAYIAPEQIQGRPADARADLYALGVMYYQILTGHLPYDAPGVSDVVAKIMAICYQHVNAPIPSARTRNPDIPPDLDALTQRLMAKTPEARPASAAEVIPILEACLRPAGPPTAPTQTGEGLAPRASAAAPGAPVPLETSAPAPARSSAPPPESAPAPESPIAPTQAVVPPPKRDLRPWLALPVGLLILVVSAVLLWPKPGGDVPAPSAIDKQADEERRRLQAEVDASRKQVEELRNQKLREEQQRQQEAKKAEDARKAKEAQEAKARADDLAKKQAEADRQKAEAAKQAEADRLRREEEAKTAQLQEQRRQEDARKAKEAQEAKARAEEAQKLAQAARPLEPAELQRHIAQRLLDNGISGLTVAVSSDRSIRLTGAVDSIQKRDQALKLASGLRGVTQIRDRILVTAGCREPALAPRYFTGEKWTWQNDRGRMWTDSVIAEGDMTEIKAANGDVLSYDKERVLRKVVRRNGEVVTEGLTPQGLLGVKWLDFPLVVGKKWQYQFSIRVTPGFRILIDQNTVVTCETLTTAAGKMEAFKIETVTSRVAGSPGEKGVAYRWYAPQAKQLIRRQYVPSEWYPVDRYRDFELVRYETE